MDAASQIGLARVSFAMQAQRRDALSVTGASRGRSSSASGSGAGSRRRRSCPGGGVLARLDAASPRLPLRHPAQRAPARTRGGGRQPDGGRRREDAAGDLARAHLRDRGLRVGVLSRGYPRRGGTFPATVTPTTDPAVVGDEPVLIAQRTGCPWWSDPDRVRGGRWLLGQMHCDLLVADDGLQHYRLDRDLEVAVVDGRATLRQRSPPPGGTAARGNGPAAHRRPRGHQRRRAPRR